MGHMDRLTINPAKIVTFALLAGLALIVAPAASAHTSLVSEAPEDGSVVTELADVRLEFSDELLDLGNSIALTDADGTSTDLEIDLSVPRVLSAPLPADLAAGEYVVNWRAVANDGHPLEDTIAFTYQPEALPSSSTTPSSAAEAPAPTPSAPVSESAAPTPAASTTAMPESSAGVTNAQIDVDSDPSSSVWWWIIGIGLVVGIGVGILMWRRGSTPVAGAQQDSTKPDDSQS